MTVQPAISVEGLTKTYAGKSGPVQALRGVSFTVRQGEVFGLLGPNGAGKTTLIHTLAGLVRPTGGTARVMGADVVTDYRSAHAAIGLAGQEPDFDWWITCRDALIYHCGYHGIPRAEAAPRADRLLKRFGLWEKRDEKVEHLSGGQKRRVLIARAVIHEPPVVILDEPTAGVDVELRHMLWDFVRELHANGTTVVLTTHYLEEAESLCDRIAIVNHGGVVALDTPERLMAASERDIVVLDMVEPVPMGAKLPEGVASTLESMSDDRRILMLQGTDGGPLAANAMRALDRVGFEVASVSITKKRLEDVFRRLTTLRDAESGPESEITESEVTRSA